MLNRDEIQLMVQAARLYYENNLNQILIARRMGTTRQKVSRLLDDARSQGIVRISIHDPYTRDPSLAEDLKEAFNLHEVILVAGEGLENDALRSGIGLVAAKYLQDTFQDGQLVGMGWGRTLFSTMNSLAPGAAKRIHIVPIIGGIGDLSPFFQVNELARRLAEAIGGTYRSLYAPAFVEDHVAYGSLLKTDEIAQAIALWDRMDIAVVGIGHVEFQEFSSMFFAEHVSPRTLARLEANGAVGDICARFFDCEGRQVDPETGVIGIRLEQLKTVPEVIAIAGGMEKVRAISGALQGGYIHTLVTDTATARAVLAETRGRGQLLKGGVRGEK